MSKNHNFYMLSCCTFILSVFLTGLLSCSIISKVQYTCNTKGTYAPCYIHFTECSLDKK